MLTFKQYCICKRRLTQAQRAGIPDRDRAIEVVAEMIVEALAISYRRYPDGDGGLLHEDLLRIFNQQPVHWDDHGYVPHWFSQDGIEDWAKQIFDVMVEGQQLNASNTDSNRISL